MYTDTQGEHIYRYTGRIAYEGDLGMYLRYDDSFMDLWLECIRCIVRESSHSYRVAKTHRMPYLYRSFSAKEPYS